jgi:hypothetical protein
VVVRKERFHQLISALNCTRATRLNSLCCHGEISIGLQGEQVRRLSSHPVLAHLRAPAQQQIIDGPSISSQGPGSSRVTAGTAAGQPFLPVVACLHLVPNTLRKLDVYQALCGKLPRASCQHVVLDDGVCPFIFCCCTEEELLFVACHFVHCQILADVAAFMDNLHTACECLTFAAITT